jgi:hypothetical protein
LVFYIFLSFPVSPCWSVLPGVSLLLSVLDVRFPHAFTVARVCSGGRGCRCLSLSCFGLSPSPPCLPCPLPLSPWRPCQFRSRRLLPPPTRLLALRWVPNKIASLTARLANATARGLFQEATLLGADWADFKEDYRGIYTQFVDHGMAHKEVMQLVALRHQSARHKLMVDIMSMLYPALKAQLFSPTVGVARPSLPSFTAPTVPSNRHAHLQCNFCNGMGRISPNCPARQRDRRDLVKGTVPGARGAPSATLLLVHLVLRV